MKVKAWSFSLLLYVFTPEKEYISYFLCLLLDSLQNIQISVSLVCTSLPDFFCSVYHNNC